MFICFLAVQPETVISIVQVGRLPDNLPDWFMPKEITCFEKISDSISTSRTNKHQTFVLELHVPTPLDSELLTYVCAGRDKTGHVLAKQIKTEWIEKIFVYSTRGKKLLSRLFNDECPKIIEMRSDIYPKDDLAGDSKSPLEAKIDRFPFLRVTLQQGDILGSRMQTIINTVNCVGVMGKGIALAFKLQYPTMFEDYRERCRRKEVRLGEPYLYKVNEDRWVLNFPTKGHWREKSHIQDIEKGLAYLTTHVSEWGITSLAIPPLGCGNGGLDWEHVYSLIREYVEPLGIPTEIYVPFTKTKAARQHPDTSMEKPESITSFFKRTPPKRRKTQDAFKGRDIPLLKSTSKR